MVDVDYVSSLCRDYAGKGVATLLLYAAYYGG